MNWPETSSITTICGSFLAVNRATRPDTHTPNMATSSATNTSMESCLMKRLLVGNPPTNQWGNKMVYTIQYNRTPTIEPHVPGTAGRYPAPPAVAKNSESHGLRTLADGAASVFVLILRFHQLHCCAAAADSRFRLHLLPAR